MKVELNASEVRRILAKRNMSQNRLAQKIGTTSGYLSQMLAGKRYPSPQMRKKILKVLQGVEFDKLFTLLD